MGLPGVADAGLGAADAADQAVRDDEVPRVADAPPVELVLQPEAVSTHTREHVGSISFNFCPQQPKRNTMPGADLASIRSTFAQKSIVLPDEIERYYYEKKCIDTVRLGFYQ